MRLRDGKSILLFRFHQEVDVAHERIKIIKYFNPDLPVYALFGGREKEYEKAAKELAGITEHVWLYPGDKSSDWKWLHTDLMTKDWYRQVGKDLEFDFLYSYEYDLLTLKPLDEIYPNVDTNTLVLAAVTELDGVEQTWSWTGAPEKRPNWLKFQAYMREKYGLEKQKYVCLGPGPLLPRDFLEKFADAEDVEFVHEEITLPAYAEVLGFKLADHGMHPGFKLTPEERFFSCRISYRVSASDVREQVMKPRGRRTFHPVKEMVTLDEVSEAAFLDRG